MKRSFTRQPQPKRAVRISVDSNITLTGFGVITETPRGADPIWVCSVKRDRNSSLCTLGKLEKHTKENIDRVCKA